MDQKYCPGGNRKLHWSAVWAACKVRVYSLLLMVVRMNLKYDKGLEMIDTKMPQMLLIILIQHWKSAILPANMEWPTEVCAWGNQLLIYKKGT